jgi:hypothetical protein
MTVSVYNLNRRGISMMEILIGIMVLGIGVISLATLFPIGLLKMKRAVNDVRGTVLARSALSEVRIRNLLAPPFGPAFDTTATTRSYFSAYPAPWTPTAPTIGRGMPVIIDPLWMIQSPPSVRNLDAYHDRFGFADFDADGAPDFSTGEGLLRVRGGDLAGAYPLELASEVFSSSDDLTYGENDARLAPLQGLSSTAGQLLLPTNGTPFAPASLLRERRYTWMILARKVNAGQVYHPGPNGVVGTPVADADDVLENTGPDLTVNTADDPARNMLTGAAEPAPVGPFSVTIIVFYTRDFGSREAVFANDDSAVMFRQGSDLAYLLKRTDNVPFPDIPVNSYIIDTTMDTTNGIRNGYVYRVVSKSADASGNMTLVLDQKARANGYVLTVLKGAVGVFEKQVP